MSSARIWCNGRVRQLTDLDLDRDRVIEVWAPANGAGRLGSGYLLEPGLVLTARHVVDTARGRGCEVRPLGTKDWVPVDHARRAESCDAALLCVSSRALTGHLEPARLGRVAGGDRVPCEALGFPWAQERPVSFRDAERDTEHLKGEIDPLSGVKSGALTIHIQGSVPSKRAPGHSPWEGMSGAAVFAGPLICGVVTVDPARFGSDRLEAVPIPTIARDPVLREVFQPRQLRAVEAEGLLVDPYRPLPRQAAAETLGDGAMSLLLWPEFGIVPFGGREVDLEWLDSWQRASSGLSVALVLGQGGTGKSRLAAEFCSTRQREGVVTGFLGDAVDARLLQRLARVREPLAIVVDEAHVRLEQTAELVTTFAANGRAAPSSVVLLARQAGDWWTDLLPSRVDDPGAQLALETAATRDLAPVASSAPEREHAFLAACRAFAERSGQGGMGAVATPDLSGALFESILFIHLAALSALEPSNPSAGSPLRDDLLDFALRREGRYWSRTASAAGIRVHPRVLERSVATATLTEAADENDAARALAAIPDLSDAGQSAVRDLAWWLRDLYPGASTPGSFHDADASEPWFRPLIPDLLAEALVARVVTAVPELATSLAGTASPGASRRILSVLTNAARAYPRVEGVLRRTVDEHFSSVWETAIEIAQEAGDPLGHVLAEVLERHPNREVSQAMVKKLPDKTVALRELWVVALEQSLDG